LNEIPRSGGEDVLRQLRGRRHRRMVYMRLSPARRQDRAGSPPGSSPWPLASTPPTPPAPGGFDQGGRAKQRGLEILSAADPLRGIAAHLAADPHQPPIERSPARLVAVPAATVGHLGTPLRSARCAAQFHHASSPGRPGRVMMLSMFCSPRSAAISPSGQPA